MRCDHTLLTFASYRYGLFPCENDIYYESIWVDPENSLITKLLTGNPRLVKQPFPMRSRTYLIVDLIRNNINGF